MFAAIVEAYATYYNSHVNVAPFGGLIMPIDEPASW
jgi:hypothetical protein